MKQRWMWVVWPSFLMAGVMELLVFAVLDPQGMSWFGQPFDMSRQTIYTLSFFVFWLIISISSALTVLLSLTSNEVNHPSV